MTGRQKGWNRRLALGGGAAAALGVGYLALRPSKKTPTPRHVVLDPSTYYRGNAAEPETLDPCLAQGVQEDAIVGDLLVGLMTGDASAKPIPGMATSWTTSSDGLTWTFKLREALWSDGTPVTADDFVFAWRRILDPKTAAFYAYFLFLIKNAQAINAGKMPLTALGARALDAHTFEINLVHPAPYLLEMLTHLTMLPQPRHVVEAKGKSWAQPGNYVSNGPFVLTEWVPNGHVTVVKNPRFYDAENVALERIIYFPTDDYGAALQRLRAGELDTQGRLPSEQIDWIRANMPELLNPVPQLILDFVSVNLTRKPFDDVRVRTAMNLAINREAITQRVTHVGYVPAYNLVPPNTANFPGGNEFYFRHMSPGQRIAEGKRLMRESGFGPNKRVQTTYMIRATTPGIYRAIAAALQQMFSLVYVDVSIVPNDMAIFYDSLEVQNYDTSQPGWSADFDDASNFLDIFRTDSGNNWGKYSNLAYDAMLDSAQRETDITSRGRKLAEAEAILLKDQAFMPLFFWVSGNLVRPYVKGWVANNLDQHRSRWISFDQKARAALLV
jgi:oligopeptide transport system substrate-binding protein